MKPALKNKTMTIDPWESLREYTNARIALGSAGTSIPNKEVMNLRLAHANAKDAIYTELDIPWLESELKKLGLPFFSVQSKIHSRDTYLKRPDLGKMLDEQSIKELTQDTAGFDFLFILADGLSARAVNGQSIPMIKQSLKLLPEGLRIGIVLASNARVALGDEVGQRLNAPFIAILIGERPGLSSPESMGVYTTYAPKPGLTDERRNCISNIHDNGMSAEQAAQVLHYLYSESMRKRISGVEIKVDLNQCINKI